MLRPSRALCVALLWLAVLLLPVRGWATVAMPLGAAGEAAAQMQADVAEPAGASLPCHGSASTADPTDDGAAPQQSCSMCDVCHSAFADLPKAQPALPGRSASPTGVATVKAVEPAVLSGPERPPRSLLA